MALCRRKNGYIVILKESAFLQIVVVAFQATGESGVRSGRAFGVMARIMASQTVPIFGCALMNVGKGLD
jgi:hypothetical protein